MDALEILKSDHERILDLFQQLQTAQTENRQKTLYSQIKAEFDVHAYLEETVFYPPFQRFDETRSLVANCFDEHKGIHKKFFEIDQIREHLEEFKAHTDELKKEFQTHFNREEEELFPHVRKLMRRPEREQLGRHLLAARQEREIAA